MPLLKSKIITTAPNGWSNVASTDLANLGISASLFVNSTTASGINLNATPSSIATNIARQRTTLWLRSDHRVTVAFHTLIGPTASGTLIRYPKFCVCAGVDGSLPHQNPPSDAAYQSIVSAVTAFAKSNESVARLYLWIEQSNPPVVGDVIHDFFIYATSHEIAPTEGAIPAESPGGTTETYTQPPIDPKATVKQTRWPTNLTTFKLRLV
jgi:hypothetical protein